MRFCFFANSSWYLYNFRLKLFKTLKKAGHDVILISPPGEYVEDIRSEGFECKLCNVNRKSFSLINGIKSLTRMIKIIYKTEPDILHCFTMKGIAIGSLAGIIARVPHRVNAFTGLGYYLSRESDVSLIKINAIKQILKMSCSRSTIIFENKDDKKRLVEMGIAKKSSSHVIESSGGVDIEHFEHRKISNDKSVVAIISRMLWSKGVGVFVEAAKKLKEDGCEAEFYIVGGVDKGSRDAIPKSKLIEWDSYSGIKWLGFRQNIKSVIANTNMVCLPTMYGEGIPTVLMEAGAMGRPLIASDVPGSREMVIDGENGFLVPPGDSIALAGKIYRLLRSYKDQKRMGRRSRKLVEKRFSEDKIVNETIGLYEKIKK